MTPQPKSSGRGCLFWGGIIVSVLLTLFLVAIYAGYCYVRHIVYKYTDSKPVIMTTVHLSDAEITNLQTRIQSFGNAIESNAPVGPLVLTADEINALIARQSPSNGASPVHLYFSFETNRIQAQLSLGLDGIGWRMLKGRYLNGSGDFRVSLHDGRLFLRVKSLSVKGNPLPEQFMQAVRAQNFADGWTNNPDLSQAVGRLQEIKVEDGKLFVIPKAQETNATPKLEVGK